MNNYEKGLLDGSKTALYGHPPKFGCVGDDTAEYKQGVLDSTMKIRIQEQGISKS